MTKEQLDSATKISKELSDLKGLQQEMLAVAPETELNITSAVNQTWTLLYARSSVNEKAATISYLNDQLNKLVKTKEEEFAKL